MLVCEICWAGVWMYHVCWAGVWMHQVCWPGMWMRQVCWTGVWMCQVCRTHLWQRGGQSGGAGGAAPPRPSQSWRETTRSTGLSLEFSSHIPWPPRPWLSRGTLKHCYNSLCLFVTTRAFLLCSVCVTLSSRWLGVFCEVRVVYRNNLRAIVLSNLASRR